jgi:hypothetical protein
MVLLLLSDTLFVEVYALAEFMTPAAAQPKILFLSLFFLS